MTEKSLQGLKPLRLKISYPGIDHVMVGVNVDIILEYQAFLLLFLSNSILLTVVWPSQIKKLGSTLLLYETTVNFSLDVSYMPLKSIVTSTLYSLEFEIVIYQQLIESSSSLSTEHNKIMQNINEIRLQIHVKS